MALLPLLDQRLQGAPGSERGGPVLLRGQAVQLDQVDGVGAQAAAGQLHLGVDARGGPIAGLGSQEEAVAVALQALQPAADEGSEFPPP